MQAPGFRELFGAGIYGYYPRRASKDAVNTLYLRTKDAGGVYDFTKKYISVFSGVNYSYNDELLMFMGVSNNDNFTKILYRLAAILIVLVMFGSISLIYNAFSISVGERTKQFGLLSSVGATGKQLYRSVLFEALFVSLIGIPLGIIVGLPESARRFTSQATCFVPHTYRNGRLPPLYKTRCFSNNRHSRACNCFDIRVCTRAPGIPSYGYQCNPAERGY
jgi:hypothetical protein